MAYSRQDKRLDCRLSDDSIVFNIAFATKQHACRRAETGRTNNIFGDAVARKRIWSKGLRREQRIRG